MQLKLQICVSSSALSVKHQSRKEEITKLQSNKVDITKTHLYNFDPFKPHFYIVKLGFTVVYIIFPILRKKILWALVRIAEAVLTSTHNLCFEQKYEK